MIARLDEAVEKLRAGILSGKFTTGDKLGAADLANELGMSRTPIREAFHVLASEGLVELTKGRGARVSMWSNEELESIFDARIRLEGLATRRAAERITMVETDRLHELAVNIADAALPGPQQDLIKRQQLNMAFHQTIIKISGSPTIATALTGVMHASVLVRTQRGYDEEAQERIANHHFDIVAALRAGDGDWAESTMRSHLFSARASLLGPRRDLDPGVDSVSEQHD